MDLNKDIDERFIFSRPSSPESGCYDVDEVVEESFEETYDTIPEPTLWEKISKDYERQRDKYTKATAVRKSPFPVNYDIDSASKYLAKEVFPVLMPALKDTLAKAITWKCLKTIKCRFNGIDNIVEYIWNKNPLHQRGDPWLDVYDIPFVKLWLRDHPRPFFPLSWLLSDDEAARIIQRNVRGFLVRRRDDVQEMRVFWRQLAVEREEAEVQRKAQERANFYEDMQDMIFDETIGKLFKSRSCKRKESILALPEDMKEPSNEYSD